VPNPAILYRMTNRGFIREGYFADLTLVDLNSQWTVAKENLLYKCLVTIGGHHFYYQSNRLCKRKTIYDHGEFHEEALVWQ
jgi:dihydroorotase